MKKPLFTLSILFCLISLLGCPKRPPIPPRWFPKLSDYTELHITWVDSSTNPYTTSNYDTVFEPHSQYSYWSRFPEGDSIELTDYTVTPNKTIEGHRYTLLGYPDNSRVVLLFPNAIPDTVNYASSDNDSRIILTFTINKPALSESIIKIFSNR